MKHSAWVVLVLIGLFLLAQSIGLFVLDSYVDKESTTETGVPTYEKLPAGLERPSGGPIVALVTIVIAVIIGTLILLLIIKTGKTGLWKAWYFLAVSISLTVALTAFMPQLIAGIVAVAASSLKILKPNFIVHNLTELFIYGGMAVIFVPVLNVFSAAGLLILISVYDVFAVRGSKHMVKLARFQTSSRIFAGLSIPKSIKHIIRPIAPSRMNSSSKDTPSIALLGGGDIGFPLLFAGTVMAQQGMAQALLIPLSAAVGLAALFAISKKGKFYPAMPFVSAGCFVGYGIAALI